MEFTLGERFSGTFCSFFDILDLYLLTRCFCRSHSCSCTVFTFVISLLRRSAELSPFDVDFSFGFESHFNSFFIFAFSVSFFIYKKTAMVSILISGIIYSCNINNLLWCVQIALPRSVCSRVYVGQSEASFPLFESWSSVAAALAHESFSCVYASVSPLAASVSHILPL